MAGQLDGAGDPGSLLLPVVVRTRHGAASTGCRDTAVSTRCEGDGSMMIPRWRAGVIFRDGALVGWPGMSDSTAHTLTISAGQSSTDSSADRSRSNERYGGSIGMGRRRATRCVTAG